MFKPSIQSDIATTQVVRKSATHDDLIVKVSTVDDAFRVVFRANNVPMRAAILQSERAEIHLHEFDLAVQIARDELARFLNS